jgi:L-alanine-DL-glutamate epimerase-like enolase superfamily enzyme
MHPINRRCFIKSTSILAVSGTAFSSATCQSTEKTTVNAEHPPHYPEHILDIHSFIAYPVKIKSIEVFEAVGEKFIVTTSEDGHRGITLLNFRMEYFMPIMQKLLIPFFLNRDARDIEQIMDDIQHERVVYKYSGIPLFNALGHIEISIMDLLGKVAGVPAGTFFGKMIRSELPMYCSSLTRETSPEEEVANLQHQLDITGCKAVKIKIGGRMSKGKDASEGRTETLIPLARKVLGDDITIYADSNSSYNAEQGIKIAAMLEDNGVAIFEEPCYWEDYTANKKVADTLTTMKLAGGEQDTSYLRFRDIIENRVYHVVQPDLYYNGGLLRTHYVGKMAEKNGLTIAPHSPKADPLAAPFFQFAAVSPILEGFQEYPFVRMDTPDWYAPHFTIMEGKVKVPQGAGLGLEYDMSIFNKAMKIF